MSMSKNAVGPIGKRWPNHQSSVGEMTRMFNGSWLPFANSPSMMGAITRHASLLIFSVAGVGENSKLLIISTMKDCISRMAKRQPMHDLSYRYQHHVTQNEGENLAYRTPPAKLSLRKGTEERKTVGQVPGSREAGEKERDVQIPIDPHWH